MRTTQERLTLRSNVCSAASALLPLCCAIEPTTLTPTEKKKALDWYTNRIFFCCPKEGFLNFFMYVYIIGSGSTGCV